MRQVFTLITIISLCWPSLLSAQKPNKLGKAMQSVNTYSQNKSRLSMDKLSKATYICYSWSQGSWQDTGYGYIEVTPTTVKGMTYEGEGQTSCETHRISPAKYKQFLNNLVRQDIRKTPYKDPGVGGWSATLTIKVNKKVIFEGEEHASLSIAKGDLGDAFNELLSHPE